jgi:hypothetical protein
MKAFPQTERTAVTRKQDRARYERDVVYGIIDEAYICHVGLVLHGRPVVLPTIHARLGDVLYLHGSTGSGWLSALRPGAEVSVTATILDGLVLARSATHHSMNYRSAVVYGQASEVSDPAEKIAALRAVVEHVLRGRWDECRAPNERELASTLVLAVPLVEASAKVRTGPPVDDEADYGLDVWAGEVPLRIASLGVVPDPRLGAGIGSAASLRSLA